MITAEYSSEVQIVDEDPSFGSLIVGLGTIYNEFQVINCTNEPIYAIDYMNRKCLIRPQKISTYGDDRRIEIRSRIVEGYRTTDHRGVENSKGHMRTIKIPYELLRDEPVFVHETNAVLCFSEQIMFVKHPHSKEVKEETTKEYRKNINDALTAVPMLLNANDPSGKITSLFFEINGTICSTKVTNIHDEPDYVTLMLRNKHYSINEMTKCKTSFSELFTEDRHIWTIGDQSSDYVFRISDSRELLEKTLEIERSKRPNVIEVSSVTDLIKKATEERDEKIEHLNEEVKELRRQNAFLKSSNESLRNGDYQERVADVVHEKLRLEEMKVHQAQRETEQARRKTEQDRLETELASKIERSKLYKEIINTVATIAKAVAVIIPAGLGIFKVVQAFRTA